MTGHNLPFKKTLESKIFAHRLDQIQPKSQSPSQDCRYIQRDLFCKQRRKEEEEEEKHFAGCEKGEEFSACSNSWPDEIFTSRLPPFSSPPPPFPLPAEKGEICFLPPWRKGRGGKVPPPSSPLFLAVSGAITSLRAEGKTRTNFVQ